MQLLSSLVVMLVGWLPLSWISCLHCIDASSLSATLVAMLVLRGWSSLVVSWLPPLLSSWMVVVVAAVVVIVVTVGDGS